MFDTSSATSLPGLHAAFAPLLIQVERYARFAFRAIRCPQSRDDAIQETRGLAWRQFLHYASEGIDPSRFPRLFARRLVGSVNDGRRTACQDRRNDVLSPRAHLFHGLNLIALGDWPDETLDPWREALTDNARTPVPEQVAFRLDLPCWLQTLRPRHRRMVLDLLAGRSAKQVAQEHGVTLSYFCRLRKAWQVHWEAFRHGLPLPSLRTACGSCAAH